MIDVSLPIRRAYITRLRSAITWEGEPVPVFGRIVPEDTDQFPYIYIPQQLSGPRSHKTDFGFDHTVTLEVVYRRSDGSGSDVIDEIGNLVMQELLPWAQSDVIQVDEPGIQVNSAQLVDTTVLIERTDTFWYFRNVIRIEHWVEQTAHI